jgi:hypothetical protein
MLLCRCVYASRRRKKEEAITALPAHRNIEEAAKAVGTAANTLFRWLKAGVPGGVS